MVWKREIIGKLSKWIGKAIISSFFDSIQFNSEIKFLNWIAFRKKFVIKLTANSMYDPESPKDRAVLRVTLHIKANIWILNLITHKACCWWETLSLNAILSRSYFFSQRDFELKMCHRQENWHGYQLAYIDRILLKAFPIMFLFFNLVYWPICLT